MPTVSANGIDLYYEVHFPDVPQPHSADRTPLLLITGMGQNSVCWRKNLPYLTTDRTVIVFDNRGTGRSAKPDQPYSLSTMADDTAAFLDAIGINRVHVFGFSLGSLIAQEFALNHTHRVKSLILGASTAGGIYHTLPPAEVISTMASLGWSEPAAAVEIAVPILYSPGFIARHPDQIRADSQAWLLYPTPPYTFRRQAMAAYYHSTYSRLDQLPMPTLLLAGEEDLLVPPQNSQIMTRRLPYAEMLVLRNAGHYFISEQPQATAQAIQAFLARHFASLAYSSPTYSQV